jgi:hypothetical protein
VCALDCPDVAKADFPAAKLPNPNADGDVDAPPGAKLNAGAASVEGPVLAALLFPKLNPVLSW